MILSIADDDVSGRSDGDTLEALELPVAAAPTAEGAEKTALRCEYLYAIVARVRDNYEALIVDRHATGKLELSLLGALGAEGRQHTPVDVEYLDPVVVAVADYDTIRAAHRYVMRMFQLTTSATARAELTHECSIRLEHLLNSK